MAYTSRGEAYYKKGQYNAAINDFNEAIRLDPNDEDAYFGRENAYRMKKQDDTANNDYN